ncbi:unnamed protein product, partial [Mesorhabditis belari]|uniref:Transmembrane 9 superfamily member n=1 Tax=Mesorhabditis belari TaxID=2138241 RepID=A0AAF3J2D1_9BILA
MGLFFRLFVLALLLDRIATFYVPGVAPVEFAERDSIEVKGIKLTSTKTVIPYEYYALPFCRPKGKLHYNSENIGELLRGDRIVNTPLEFKMAVNVSCASSCVDSTEITLTKEQSAELMSRIREDYHVHLLVDNLPVSTRLELRGNDESAVPEIYYDIGYKLGTIGDKGEVILHNHLDFVLKYHKQAGPDGVKYRVVGFEVHPRSIDASKFGDDSTCVDDHNAKPLILKDTEDKKSFHWTYTLHWEQSDIPWASRWDVLLSIKGTDIHWFSILNSIIVIISLSGFLSISIVRTLRRDITQYNRLEEEDDTLEETGWKLVHGDVFRPPRHQMILVNMVGTGIQLIGMAAVTIACATLGMLSPSSRGSLTSASLVLYCLMGLFAGYHAGRLYKTMKGRNPIRCAVQTGFLFPSMILGGGFIINFFLISKNSSGAVPFGTMVVLLLMWFGIDLPLVFIGFYFGYRKHGYTHPVRTNQIPRQVPEQPWFLQSLPATLLAGILPFGAMFIELFFIFSALWENQFYYLFGFLMIVSVILAISTAQISIVATYFQLCAENYRWWWRSFYISAGSAIYVMLYALFYYYTKLNIVGFVPTVLYFSYSFLMALTLWFMTGTIGFYAAYYFLCKIYGSIKID